MTTNEGLRINSRIVIPMREIELSYARSGGPGGQNVNKVSSKAQLRFSLRDTPSIPEAARARALARLASRTTTHGEIILSCSVYRDQPRNREAALRKLRDVLAAAIATPKRRVPTRPSRGAKERRLQEKKAHGRRKAVRSSPPDD